MNRADWILIRTSSPEVIRPAVEQLSSRCEHNQPEPRTVRVWQEAEGLYALEFFEKIGAVQFEALVCELADTAGVDEAIGWVDGAADLRYQLEAHPIQNGTGETQLLAGASHLGARVHVYAPSYSMCEVSEGPVTFEEPERISGAAQIYEWQVTMDGDIHPLLTTTHPKDHKW